MSSILEVDKLAQLVKLQDYISRYQMDLKRYTTQYIRMKKQQWERTTEKWEQGLTDISLEEHNIAVESPQKKSFFSMFFNRSNEKPLANGNRKKTDENVSNESSYLHFHPTILHRPQSKEELRRMYVNQLFQFQLKWASSTLRERSYMDPKYTRDMLLQTLTLQLPDNYFLFYYPILKLKNAPVELDIILVLPSEIVCIVVLEARDLDAFLGSGDRFWVLKSGDEEKKILSPLIGLNRMESILVQICKKKEIDLPIRKVILSRNGYIDFPGTSFNTLFIDTRNFNEWFTVLKSSPSPMKHVQMKAVQAILDLVETTSYSRVSSDNGEG